MLLRAALMKAQQSKRQARLLNVKEQAKVVCRCAEGHCFLEEDAARAKQNHAAAQAQAGGRGAALPNYAVFHRLDDERLRHKSEWLESLGVHGTIQVQCCKEATESS